MCDRTSTDVGPGRLTDLTDRFIQETNDFLSSHRDDPGAGWPLKAAVREEVEELITRLMHSCRVIHPREGGAACPRYAILLVVDGEPGPTNGGSPVLTTRVFRPPARRKRGAAV